MTMDKILDFDDQEHVLMVVRRHPIGMAGHTLAGVGLFCAFIAAVYYIAKNQDTITEYASLLSVFMFAGGVFFLLGLFTYISIFLYIRNEMVVTTENIIQVLQPSLFHRQVSQLSLGKVQDVTVIQSGFLASIFNYGTVHIETAGEFENFTFPFAEDPHVIGKSINEAHDAYMRDLEGNAASIQAKLHG